MQSNKPNDFKDLEDLNIRIGIEESKRDQESYDWFVGIIAPELAFKRADPKKPIDNRCEFLKSVEPLKHDAPKPDSRETKVESIEIYGNRAVVKCVVTFGGSKYHNLRLFVRRDNQWKLLGWANEQQ
jgi:hypothetical protein